MRIDPTRSTVTTATDDGTGSPTYGLRRPDLDEARRTLGHVLTGADLERVWTALLRQARLTGTETGPDADPEALRRLLDAMAAESDVLALCATSLRIRLQTYEKLVQVSTIVRSAS